VTQLSFLQSFFAKPSQCVHLPSPLHIRLCSSSLIGPHKLHFHPIITDTLYVLMCTWRWDIYLVPLPQEKIALNKVEHPRRKMTSARIWTEPNISISIRSTRCHREGLGVMWLACKTTNQIIGMCEWMNSV